VPWLIDMSNLSFPQVTIRLVPHAKAPAAVYRLRRCYVTTSGRVRLAHVVKFLTKQLRLPSDVQVTLSVSPPPPHSTTADEQPSHTDEQPLSDLEQTIATVWREVMPIDCAWNDCIRVLTGRMRVLPDCVLA